MVHEKTLIALQSYSAELTKKFRTLGDAQPEDQLKAPVDSLLKKLGTEIGRDIVVNTESRVEDIGRPDMAVSVGGLLCGYVELKAPGTGGRCPALP